MDPSRPRIELILQQLDQLPTLPAVAVRVLQVASSDTGSVKDICTLIESDPALTARILQLVHRADRGAVEIGSLERAVVMLGFDAVRCAVLAVAVLGVFQASSSAARFDRTAFWTHCIAVGCCAELLAQACNTNWGQSAAIEPAEAFVAGLLHDLGKIALDAAIPKSFAKAVEATDVLRGNIADVERSVIGVDHMIVGKRLAEQWQLPHALREVIWLHGQLPQALPPSVRNDRLVNLVTLADLLVREQHIGYSGNYAFPVNRQVLADALNLLPQQVETATAKLVEAIEVRARALGIGAAAEASDVYRGALQQAHRELSRVTDQLAARNRKLTIRARYFEAVASFQSELRPDAPPAVILHAIGQTAAGVLETPAVAVFSVPPGAGFAEVSVVDRHGDIVQTHLVEATEIVKLGSPGAGPVQAVGAEMEWLLQAFSPTLASGQRYWIGLEADASCIGGVMWGAAAGEADRLSPQTQELTALAVGWSLALRTCQIRDEARALAEQLADANRQLQTAQTEIYRTRMLTSIGEIAAGAAHEMNNPLAVISGRSQLLASTLAEPRQREAAKLIYEKSQTLSDLITALMHFAKPQPPRPGEVELSTIVDLAIAQAKEHSGNADRHIEVRVDELPRASVDAQQVSAALAEIVSNAIQATDAQAGRLTLSANFDAMSQRLVLTIADNGCGMDEHVLRHAFDPFFSAKRAGRRQGMGLAKAQRWIESSGGTVRLESRPGEGTRAIVILPAAGAAVQAQQARMRQAT